MAIQNEDERFEHPAWMGFFPTVAVGKTPEAIVAGTFIVMAVVFAGWAGTAIFPTAAMALLTYASVRMLRRPLGLHRAEIASTESAASKWVLRAAAIYVGIGELTMSTNEAHSGNATTALPLCAVASIAWILSAELPENWTKAMIAAMPWSTPTVEFRMAEGAQDLEAPRYASELAAGCDLPANVPTDAPVTIEPGAMAAIDTGVMIALPPGWEAQVRPRSGLAFRNHLTIMNAPGTIDADYRGTIVISLTNLGREPFVVTRGMRIAQMIVARAPQASLKRVGALSETVRNTAGFGSTGLDELVATPASPTHGTVTTPVEDAGGGNPHGTLDVVIAAAIAEFPMTTPSALPGLVAAFLREHGFPDARIVRMRKPRSGRDVARERVGAAGNDDGTATTTMVAVGGLVFDPVTSIDDPEDAARRATCFDDGSPSWPGIDDPVRKTAHAVYALSHPQTEWKDLTSRDRAMIIAAVATAVPAIAATWWMTRP